MGTRVRNEGAKSLPLPPGNTGMPLSAGLIYVPSRGEASGAIVHRGPTRILHDHQESVPGSSSERVK